MGWGTYRWNSQPRFRGAAGEGRGRRGPPAGHRHCTPPPVTLKAFLGGEDAGDEETQQNNELTKHIKRANDGFRENNRVHERSKPPLQLLTPHFDDLPPLLAPAASALTLPRPHPAPALDLHTKPEYTGPRGSIREGGLERGGPPPQIAA